MDDTRAGLKQWFGLAVLVLPTLVVALDMNALFLALPRLSSQLGASGAQQLWITDSYGFMVAGLVITMGTLGDRIGRRRLLMIGAAGFTIASVLAAYATTAPMLIGARVAMGIAGATLMPSTLALISNMFRDDRQRGNAISIWATSMFAGAALGPVFGGFLLRHFWWGSVFLIAVPVMLLLLITAPALLPEYSNPSADRLDLVSSALSLAAVLPFVYGLKQLAAGVHSGRVVPVAAMLAGAILASLFVRRQLALPDPLLDLRLFRNARFSGVLTTLILAGAVMAGVGLLVTQYLQSVLGYDPERAAILFAPMGLGVAAGTMLAPRLTRRLAPGTAIAAGLALSVPGCLLLVFVGHGSGLLLMMIGICLLALGTGPLFALGTGLVLGSVPPERAGSAASLSETGNYLGGALGLAVLGALSAAIYRRGMTVAGAPEAARQTLAGAISTTHHLPPGEAADLIHTAADAYLTSLHAMALIAAVTFAALAVLVGFTSRHQFLAVGRSGRRHQRAHPSSQLNSQGADAAGPTGDEHPVTRGNAQLVAQRLQGSQTGQRQAGRLGEVQRLGHLSPPWRTL
ncbi:MFS transporter [Kribbella sp. NPDC059898]|uniref:MFS transporter n=1 Tax=Kribbella sp. NPDC059898 TaxID=3346995 RepID=UPI00365FEA06